MPSTADTGRDAFTVLRRGEVAPRWLRHAVSEHWALPDGHQNLTLITVSENATFLLRIDGTPHSVLRVSRPGYVPSAAHIRSELHWVEALAERTDTPVPRAIATRSGDAVCTARDGRGSSWYLVLFMFSPGTILEDDFTDPLPYYRRIGAITAEFQAHSRTWQPPGGFTRFSWELSDMVGPSARWGDWHRATLTPAETRLLESAQAAALDRLEPLQKTPDTWGLIHADLRPSNIMVDADGTLTVIDFDDCGWAWFLYDFAAAFSFVEHLPITPALAREWMRGYAETTPLSEADAQDAVALSMLRRLQMLGWTTTHRSDALPADIWDAQVPGTVAIAERFAQNPLWLLTS
ncbi:MAG TPA: phosphotransferase [Pseudoclavibacter sp.]|nr:phosphotransferase [Pseudoclavibacter sp.]